MPRKGNVPKREVLPDPIYGSVVVAKLINSIMLDGKKGTAQSIVYDAFDRIKQATGENPLEVFEKALNNIMPVVEVKARRVGGANYQVPVEVRPERRQTLGLRWLTKYSRDRGERTMSERLAKGSWMRPMEPAHLLKRKKTPIRWQRLTRHLLITGGSEGEKQQKAFCCRKELGICLENFRWKK